MSESEYIQQISDIRKIITERTKFKALSGISGILAGCYAIIGAWIAYRIIYNSNDILYSKFKAGYYSNDIGLLFLVAFIVLVASIATGIFFSWKKAKESGEKLFNKVAWKILGHFSIFMLSALVLLIATYLNGYYTLLAPICLLFYGLSLIHVSSFINSEVFGLGLSIVAIGLISLFFPGYGLLCWTLGFGLMHMIYGFMMWYKYDRN